MCQSISDIKINVSRKTVPNVIKIRETISCLTTCNNILARSKSLEHTIMYTCGLVRVWINAKLHQSPISSECMATKLWIVLELRSYESVPN